MAHVTVWTSPTSPSAALLHYLVKVETLKICPRQLHQCITASLKWTRVSMCNKCIYFGSYTAMCVWNNDSWHRRPVKTLVANLVWLWTRHYQRCDWPVVTWPSEIMCACWWWTLWTHAVKWTFIYMIHQKTLRNKQYNLMHLAAIW